MRLGEIKIGCGTTAILITIEKSVVRALTKLAGSPDIMEYAVKFDASSRLLELRPSCLEDPPLNPSRCSQLGWVRRPGTTEIAHHTLQFRQDKFIELRGIPLFPAQRMPCLFGDRGEILIELPSILFRLAA